MPITSAIRALLTYYWNIWYFLAAILGSMASLFLGAWISSEASGTPITGGIQLLLYWNAATDFARITLYP